MNSYVDLDFIKNFPDELLVIIFEYIPNYRKVFLNNYFYFEYHHKLKIGNNENYIRNIIRFDNNFVFKFIIKENFIKWNKICKYIYKNIVFNNYLSFINYFIITNNSDKCKEELEQYINDNGLLSKNVFKKKDTIINKRWKL